LSAPRLEDVLSSRGMVRFLKALVKSGEATITQLMRESGLNYRLAKRYISRLEAYGMVARRRIGGITIYSCNLGNKYMALIRDLILRWEED